MTNPKTTTSLDDVQKALDEMAHDYMIGGTPLAETPSFKTLLLVPSLLRQLERNNARMREALEEVNRAAMSGSTNTMTIREIRSASLKALSSLPTL